MPINSIIILSIMKDFKLSSPPQYANKVEETIVEKTPDLIMDNGAVIILVRSPTSVQSQPPNGDHAMRVVGRDSAQGERPIELTATSRLMISSKWVRGKAV